MQKLGIVIATYNEAGNLPRLVEALEGLVLTMELRIFVVDDSSPDGTSAVAEALVSQYGNISLITRPGKLGLGSAIRSGLAEALSEGRDYLLTMDADLSHDPQDVPRLLEAAVGEDVELVQASRYMKGGGVAEWGWWRRSKSELANLLCRWLLGSPREATTNFRVYSRRAAQMVVEESRARDYEFQPECLLIAMRHGLRIVEVPIIFTGRAEGKSKLGMVQNVRWLWFFVGALFFYRLRIGRYSRVR